MNIFGSGTHSATVRNPEFLRVGERVRISGARADGKMVYTYLNKSELAQACAALCLTTVTEEAYAAIVAEANCKAPEAVNLPVEGKVKVIRITRKDGVVVEFE